MRSPVALSLFLLGSLLLGACAQSSSGIRPVRQRTLELPGGEVNLQYRADSRGEIQEVDAPADQVRTEVAAAYREMGFGVASSSSTEIVTPYLRIQGHLYDGELNSRYLDCGRTSAGRPVADTYSDLRFRMLTRIMATDGATLVETRLEGEAWRSGASGAPIPCTGTGILEHRVNVRAMAGVADPAV